MAKHPNGGSEEVETKNPNRVISAILAMLPPLVAFVVQWMFWSTIRPYAWFLFYPALFFSSWIGGLPSGLIATVISTALVWWTFIPPEHSFTMKSPRSFISAAVFMGMGVLFSFFHRRLREANQQSAQALAAANFANDQLETRVRERTGELQSINGQLEAKIMELRKLSSVVQQVPGCVVITDKDGVIEYVNASFERTTGYSREETIGKTPRILKSGKHEKKFYEAMWETILSGRVFHAEFTNRKKNGELFYQDQTILPVRDEKGDIAYFASLGRDVTKNKEIEKAFRESEEKYRELVSNINDGIFITDDKGIITFANKALAAIHGSETPEDLIGRNFLEFTSPEVRNELAKRFQDIVAGGKPSEAIVVPIIGSNGNAAVIEVKAVPEVKAGRVVGTRGVVRDVTERIKAEEALKELQQQILQSQKIEAVGQLAGGVAHDFNNILMAIEGYSELLGMKLDPSNPAVRDVLEIQKAAAQGASLTRQLLAFSRKQVLIPKVLDLNYVLGNMQSMLRRLIREDIDLLFSLAPELGVVKVDPGQIEQVIMNLAVNAGDSMPQAGKITLETGNVDLDGEYAAQHASVAPGPYVMLAVSDTGCGMDEQTRSHIFEPFFTTKEPGKGTGLGLSTVYGIVKQSGGHIEVYSEPGHGTSFKIYFPRIDLPLEPASPAVAAFSRGSTRQDGTILLVDDNDSLRSAVAAFLEIVGYQVLQASHGQEALDMLHTYDGSVDLLITDMVMPHMSGPELAKRVQPLRPNVKVLYMSGYTEEAITHEGTIEPGSAFMQKPASMNTLLSRIREMLA
jgi:PAS domain S-box-containing protein